MIRVVFWTKSDIWNFGFSVFRVGVDKLSPTGQIQFIAFKKYITFHGTQSYLITYVLSMAAFVL